MNKERVEHFITVMQEVEKRDLEQGHSHFDIGDWASNVDGHGKAKCNTVACALGWLATSEYARKNGLRLNDANYPEYESLEGSEAGEIYLDIHYTTGESLFFGSSYEPELVKPKHVIERLQYLLAVGEIEYLNYWSANPSNFPGIKEEINDAP